MSEKGRSGLRIDAGASGRSFPGFIALDRERVPGVIVCDLRLGLPFGTGTAEILTASHVLEHLHPFHELPGVLREFHRVLQPGGLLRVAVPDLQRLLRAYVDPESTEAKALAATQSELKRYTGVAYEEMPAALKFSAICFGNNSGAPYYDGHQACFDFEALRWALESIGGFRDVIEVGPTESRHPDLLLTYHDVGAAEEIVVEATRP